VPANWPLPLGVPGAAEATVKISRGTIVVGDLTVPGPLGRGGGKCFPGFEFQASPGGSDRVFGAGPPLNKIRIPGISVHIFSANQGKSQTGGGGRIPAVPRRRDWGTGFRFLKACQPRLAFRGVIRHQDSSEPVKTDEVCPIDASRDAALGWVTASAILRSARTANETRRFVSAIFEALTGGKAARQFCRRGPPMTRGRAPTSLPSPRVSAGLREKPSELRRVFKLDSRPGGPIGE